MKNKEPETFLSHKPRYKYVTQTMLSTNEPETHSLLKYVKINGFRRKFFP